MTSRRRRQLENELLKYKFLCLLVLGFCIGYGVGISI